MARRIERITVDHLDALGGGCDRCAFWQRDPVRRAQSGPLEAEEKAAWLSEVLREWGSCGRVALVDGEMAGHLLWAPPMWVPRSTGFATSPVSGDAVLIVGGWVAPAHQGNGIGRQLVQAMAKDLVKRGDVRAVEAFGGVGGCMLPVGFLLSVGFRTHRPHLLNPRMRMDLRSTLRVRQELEQALDRLLDRLPRPVPEPGAPTVLPRESGEG